MSNEPFNIDEYDDAALISTFGEFGEYSVTNNHVPRDLFDAWLREVDAATGSLESGYEHYVCFKYSNTAIEKKPYIDYKR